MKTLAFLGEKTKQNNEDFVYYFPIQSQLLLALRSLEKTVLHFWFIKYCTVPSVCLNYLWFHWNKCVSCSSCPNSVFTTGVFDLVQMDFNRRCRNHVCLCMIVFMLRHHLCCSCFDLRINYLSMEVNDLDIVTSKVWACLEYPTGRFWNEIHLHKTMQLLGAIHAEFLLCFACSCLLTWETQFLV